ncbi:LexA family transcriptional regulator [Marichromatium gracile]|nr:helix-turn-helix transcriptional regulator [Marichromatium gracile]
MHENITEVRQQNLKRLVSAAGSQRALAEKADLAPAYINQMLTGKRGIGERTARKIEARLNCNRGWLDERHQAAEACDTTSTADLPRCELPGLTAAITGTVIHPIVVWDDPADLPEGQYVLIPRRRVAFSAGNGNLVFEEEEAPPLAFTSDWARQTGVRPSNAVVVYAKGDSMEPSICDGDVLLIDIDTAGDDIRDGQVYAIRYGHELRVKRLFRRYDGSLILRSDNAGRYPEEIIPPKDQNGQVHVIGRVVWRAGGV